MRLVGTSKLPGEVGRAHAQRVKLLGQVFAGMNCNISAIAFLLVIINDFNIHRSGRPVPAIRSTHATDR